MTTERVTVTIEEDLLDDVERLRRSTGESRSAVFNRALRELAARHERVARVQRYVQAYLETPETPDEIAAVERVALEALRSAPDWEDES